MDADQGLALWARSDIETGLCFYFFSCKLELIDCELPEFLDFELYILSGSFSWPSTEALSLACLK